MGVHRDAAAYGLGVLDDFEEFEAHLPECARCRRTVAEFRSVTTALERAVRLGYLPPGDGTAGRPKSSCPLGCDRLRTGAGKLLVLALCLAATITVFPALARARIGSAADIVSPGQVVAGTGAAPRALPRSAGFQ
jgi:anti-sigma factor RsiW